jgi:hypothetical protein
VFVCVFVCVAVFFAVAIAANKMHFTVKKKVEAGLENSKVCLLVCRLSTC